MKYGKLLITLVLILGLLPMAAVASNPPTAETVDNAVDVPGIAPAGPAGWSAPEAVLWDNGPLVTHPGGGFGGADASAVQTVLGMTLYGFGHQFSLGYRMADDFEVTDPGGWNIDQITFFAYQTGSPTNPSTITGVYYQIWDGPPNDPGSSVVFGDLVTNQLTSSAWSNIYRVLDTGLTNTQRPIMADVASAGVFLGPGTYWLDWMTDGSLASGPWAPPISILGTTTTGNALQYVAGWAAALDSGSGTQQGLPFIIEGTVGGAGTPMHVGGIRGYGNPTNGIIKTWVLIEDDTFVPVPGAMVEASVWAPNWGPRTVMRPTNANGKARFTWGSWQIGTFEICVDDVVLAGYTYVPGDNVVTCKSWFFR